MRRCPCCNYLTIDDYYEEVIIDICEVCFWQYDEFSNFNPDRVIGPNSVSLNEAKENFKNFGAIEKRFINYVRSPKECEL